MKTVYVLFTSSCDCSSLCSVCCFVFDLLLLYVFLFRKRKRPELLCEDYWFKTERDGKKQQKSEMNG